MPSNFRLSFIRRRRWGRACSPTSPTAWTPRSVMGHPAPSPSTAYTAGSGTLPDWTLSCRRPTGGHASLCRHHRTRAASTPSGPRWATSTPSGPRWAASTPSDQGKQHPLNLDQGEQHPLHLDQGEQHPLYLNQGEQHPLHLDQGEQHPLHLDQGEQQMCKEGMAEGP